MYDVTIRRTTHAVAHIEANDWGSLGYGQGYAATCDHLPTIADQFVKVNSQRAFFHGAGVNNSHIASDFGYKVLDVVSNASRLKAAQPDWIQELVTGYTAGYNRRIGEVLADRSLLPAWCRDAEWISSITETDMYAYLGDVALLGSGRNLAQLIGWAQAPGPDGPAEPSPLSALGGPQPASNGWSAGADVTATGRGAVLGNPHFPWTGEGRFWECHLTIPGTLNVYGGCLLGVPGVQIGFNDNVAWTHTFSRGNRFTLYQLAFKEGDPTQYKYGNDYRQMTAQTATVQVRENSGELRQVEQELWSTHYGPMVNMPLIGWGMEMGFSVRDANAHNTRLFEQFWKMAQAQSMDEFQDVFSTYQAMPWVNTLAADSAGRAWYIDASTTPKLSPEAQERFRQRLDDDLIAALLYDNRVAMLDGSNPDDEWLDDPAADMPGVEPYSAHPQCEDAGIMQNANDSYWLPKHDVQLDTHSVLAGLDRVPQSLRTRMNLLRAKELEEQGNVTIEDLLESIFDHRSFSAELLCDAVVERARAAGSVELDGQVVELKQAADVLDAWDQRFHVDSRGAILWREFMVGFEESSWRQGNGLFEIPFDPEDPLNTPRGLVPAAEDPAADPVVLGVARAVARLESLNIALDAPLGDYQFAPRGGDKVPVPGGNEGDGVMNVVMASGGLSVTSLEPAVPHAVAPGGERTGLGPNGYQVIYGTSFLMAVEFTNDGPRAKGLLAYGQSGDPDSPHYRDGTEAFSTSTVRDLLFTNEAVESDPNLEITRLQHS